MVPFDQLPRQFRPVPVAPVAPATPGLPACPVAPIKPAGPAAPVAPMAPVAPAGPPSTISSAGEWLVVTLSLLSRKKEPEEGTASITRPKFEAGELSQRAKLAVTSMETN